ncbi:MAG: hypothetical protein ABDH32_01195 [Candidatus Caldarchaeales archaeon]
MSEFLKGLSDSDVKILIILFKSGGVVSPSKLEEDYSSKYVYDRVKILIEKGLVEKDEGLYRLTDEGVIVALRTVLTIDDLREEVVGSLAVRFKNLLDYLKARRLVEEVDVSILLDDMLRALSIVDQLFTSLPIPYNQTDYIKYAADCVVEVLKKASSSSDVFNMILSSWLGIYGLSGEARPVNSFLRAYLGTILYHFSFYSYSKLHWTIKEHLSYLLILAGMITMTIATILMFVGILL